MQKKKLLLFVTLICFFGCKDKPYGEANDASEAIRNAVGDDIPAVIDSHISVAEPPAYNFSGFVELGTPVSGAAVAVYKFSERVKSDKVAETITNPDGTYALSFKTDYAGPLLLVASGGSYRDLATREMTSIKPNQELHSAIANIKMPEKININAWTTFAVARVLANRGFWDNSVATLKDGDRINVDFDHIAHFLEGKSTHSINIRRQEILEIEKEKPKLDDTRSVLHLSHGGLSQLAKIFSEKLASDGIGISIVDVVAALANDLSDRRFDGRNANEEVVHVGSNQKLSLNSYTMRKDLSEAIFLYARQLRTANRLSEDDLLELKAVGKLVDSIATDSRPELFPENDRPLPIDITVPEISISFAGKHKNEKPFAALNGDVIFFVNAKDETNIEKIRLLAPQLTQIDDIGHFGPITVSHAQNSMDVAITCDKRKEFQSDLSKWATKKESVFCACFEAVDARGNSTRELSCFRRDEPKAQIKSPSTDDVLDRINLRNGIRIWADLWSGAALTQCSWALYNQHGEAPALKGDGKIDGVSCTIDETVSAAPLRSGDYRLIVRATDGAGRMPTSGNHVNFQVRQDLIRFPARTIEPKS